MVTGFGSSLHIDPVGRWGGAGLRIHCMSQVGTAPLVYPSETARSALRWHGGDIIVMIRLLYYLARSAADNSETILATVI